MPEKDDNNFTNVVRLFFKTNRLHHKIFDNAVKNIGIHRGQHAILMYLAQNGDISSQKNISEEFDISPACVAVTLKKLESDGLISRSASKKDTRSNCISITDKGLDVVLKSKKVFKDIDVKMFSGLSNDELVCFEECLEKMINSLNNME